MRNGRWALAVILATALLAGAESRRPFAAQQRAKGPATPMDRVAEGYVKLVLAMGAHDADYVDAYYGPPSGRPRRPRPSPGSTRLPRVRRRCWANWDERRPALTRWSTLRRQYLERQLSALAARVRMLKGERLSFDEESKALYDAVAPDVSRIALSADSRQAGEALSRQRSAGDALRGVSASVRDSARQARRGLQDGHPGVPRADARPTSTLPAGEQFTVEYVTNKSWSGYNWYQGGFRSLIQVNTDLPIYIDRAIDLACHEGYPGHHVYNALLEKHLVKDRGWIEFSVYPLFSPQSLIAEGHRQLRHRGRVSRQGARGVRTAGAVSGGRARSGEGRRILRGAGAGRSAVVRRQRSGAPLSERKIDAPTAAAWLERYALMPADRAEQRVRFFDQYRSYVINYNLGKDMVRRYIESRGGTRRSRRRALGRVREAAVVAAAALGAGCRQV